MSRIATPFPEAVTADSAEVYAQIRKAAGTVPNTFAAIGALAPAALKVMLEADLVLASGTLNRRDREAIKLAVSEAVGCDYCAAAHVQLGKFAGLTPEELKQIRLGQPTGNAKRDALVHFVRNLVRTSGTISADQFSRIEAAGYTDRQLVEISLALAVITFTNVFNRINDTTLDFPAAA
jgi:uncharacterized peroxidase-related enzyme